MLIRGVSTVGSYVLGQFLPLFSKNNSKTSLIPFKVGEKGAKNTNPKHDGKLANTHVYYVYHVHIRNV